MHNKNNGTAGNLHLAIGQSRMAELKNITKI